MSDQRKQQIRSAIYGFAVGDALGVPFEFKTRGTFRCTDMTGMGTWEQPKGTWSDDTAMVLATCDSLRENNGHCNISNMRGKFRHWARTGEYAIDRNVFDIGATTAKALRYGRGMESRLSNGNGSLMRILPLAFTECPDEAVEIVSAITHAHKISTTACVTYINIARALLQGRALTDVLSAANCKEPFERITSIAALTEDEIRSTGYVVDTLEAVLWCLTNTDGYKEAVLKAVNLGEDTDTVATLTGGLAGIIYGYDSIPKKWIRDLKGKDIIERYIEF